MKRSNDPGLLRVLEAFSVEPEALLGRGGEARVYALDAERVLRVHHPHVGAESVAARGALLAELGRGADRVPFAIPAVLEQVSCADRVATIERRLPGRPAARVLAEMRGEARAALVRAHLAAAERLGDLPLERAWFGDLLQRDPIRRERWRDYLRERAARSLAGAGAEFAGVAPAALAEALPEPAERCFVHLDAFTGNMLAEGEAISAVLDFGGVALAGDRRLDPLAAAAYLADEITPCADGADRRVAAEWLAARGLAPLFEPARRWLAAFWSAARDDAGLHDWCRSVLLGDAPPPG